MSRLPFWPRILFGLVLLLPLACNLSTVDPTITPFPTATVRISTATPTVTATATLTPTVTKTPPSAATAVPVYHLTQPLPAYVCSVVPSVDAANIRSGPGTNFPVIGVILSGNWVMANRITNTGWYQIVALGTIVNGGWISSTVVTLQQPCICTPDSCSQSGIVPPTLLPSPLPRIGIVGLQPSGVAPCVITNGGDDVPVFSMPEGLPPQIAILVPHGGLPAFDYRSGRYAVNFSTETQQFVGWVNANRVTVQGGCEVFRIPAVCSVQAPIGTITSIHTEPKRDAPVISTMNEFLPIPFIQMNADGWFNVDTGGSGKGWVAPDEGVLVGPCDNGH